jgi:hypothetical protein
VWATRETLSQTNKIKTRKKKKKPCLRKREKEEEGGGEGGRGGGWHQWLTPVILETQEAEIRRIVV